MIVCTTRKALEEQLAPLRAAGQVMGFVPTMGALHQGHISLITACRAQSDICVCSIFVNPTQFNDQSDLDKYPVTIAADKAMLEQAGCDILFLPDTKEMYPEGLNPTDHIDIGSLGKVMEAVHRPGHFEGVMQVVKILLDIVQPDFLFMGEKDFQQCAVLRKMIRHFQLPVEMVVCPTIRESDGLAMSSRNVRLTQTQRSKATILSKVLLNMQLARNENSPGQLKQKGLEMLKEEPEITVEYLDLVDADTLLPVSQWEGHQHVQACVAVRLGDVRLIDNVNIF